MKSLYNISGILPAQFRANPNDCGIAWIEHRRIKPVKREDVITVEVPPLPDHFRKIIDEMITGNSKIHAEIESVFSESKKSPRTLKPIDPQTIQVGDTVRLVGSRTIDMWPRCNLEVGEDYKVKVVDSRGVDGMSVGLYLDEFSKPFWIYDEDLMLYENLPIVAWAGPFNSGEDAEIFSNCCDPDYPKG